MAERDSLLLGLSGIRSGWDQVSDVFRSDRDFPASALSLLSGEPEFQVVSYGMLLRHISCHGFIRPADNSVWVRLPDRTAHHPAALSATRWCTFVGHSCAFLFV